MVIWRLTIVALLLGCITTIEACTDDAASDQAATVRNQVAQILEDTRTSDALVARPRDADEPDPCEGVSENAVTRVEAQMNRLNSDFVALGPEEMRALACSRSRLGR